MVQYSCSLNEKMADIAFCAFRARLRHSGGNACLDWQRGKRYVGNELLQEENEGLRRENRQRGATLLRGKLQ